MIPMPDRATILAALQETRETLITAYREAPGGDIGGLPVDRLEAVLGLARRAQFLCDRLSA